MTLAPDDLQPDLFLTVSSSTRKKIRLEGGDPEESGDLLFIGRDYTALHGAMMRVIAVALPYVYCAVLLPGDREKGPVTIDIRSAELMRLDPEVVRQVRAFTPTPKSQDKATDTPARTLAEEFAELKVHEKRSLNTDDGDVSGDSDVSDH